MNYENQGRSSKIQQRIQVPNIQLNEQDQHVFDTDGMISSQGDWSSPIKINQDTPNQFMQETQQNLITSNDDNLDAISKKSSSKNNNNNIDSDMDYLKKVNLNLQKSKSQIEKQGTKEEDSGKNHKISKHSQSNASIAPSFVLDQQQEDQQADQTQKHLIQTNQNFNEQSKTQKNVFDDENPQRRLREYRRTQYRNVSLKLLENGTNAQAQEANWNTQTNLDIEGFSPTLTLNNINKSKKSFLALNVNECSTPQNNPNKIKVYPLLSSGVSTDNLRKSQIINRVSQHSINLDKNGTFNQYLDFNKDRPLSKGDQLLGFSAFEGQNQSQQPSLINGMNIQAYYSFQGRTGENDSQAHYNQNASNQVMLSQNQQYQSIAHSQFYAAPLQTNNNNINNIRNPSESNINWNIAIKIKNISRFISKVRSQTSDFNKKNLKDFHHKLINDASDSKIYAQSGSNNTLPSLNTSQKIQLQQSNTLVREDSQEQNCLEKVFYKMMNILFKRCLYYLDNIITSEKSYVFSPEQTMIVFWNILFGLLLLFQFFYIPFSVGFDVDIVDQTKYRLLFYIIPIIACFIDSLINLNLGYYLQGLVEIDRLKIIKRYIKQFLIRDIISLFSLIMTLQTNVSYYSLLFFVRIPQLFKILEEHAEYFQLEQKYYNYYQLGNLLFMIFYISHICGCIFHYISYEIGVQSQNDLKDTWLNDAGVFYSSIFKRYVYSFYFIVITITTVGYGDIKPISVYEKIYVTIITILGSCIFAYTVNTVGTIFQEIERKKAQSKQRKYELTSYLNQRQVKKDIQIRVLKHLEFNQQREDDDPIRGMNILESVSKNLKEEVCKDFYGRILQQSKIFNLQFSQQALLDASLQFKEKILSPGEIVFKEGQANDHDIFYIYKGSIDLFVQKSRKQQRTIFTAKSGMFFGQGGFFSSAPRECSAKTITVCHLLVLSQSDFIKTLKNHTEDYEKFCVIKDEMNIYKIQQHMTCFSCGQFNHTLLNCHLIHYKRNRDLFLARYRYSIPQERKKEIIRKNYGKSSSWKQRQVVRQSLFQLRLDALNLILQNPQEITDKQFFNGVNKIKYENGFFFADYEEDEELEKLKKEGQEDEDKSSESSSSDEENLQNKLSNLSAASNISNASQLTYNQDDSYRFGNNVPHFFIQNESADIKAEETLLNSIKEVNELDEENHENKYQSQKRKTSQNLYKYSIQSQNSRRPHAQSIDDDNHLYHFHKQQTHKESSTSSARKIQSQRSLQLVTYSKRSELLEIANQNSLKTSHDSNNKKDKSNSSLVQPVFISKDSPQTSQRQNSDQKIKLQGKNKNQADKKGISDFLFNDQNVYSSDSSSLSELSADELHNKIKQNNQNISKSHQFQMNEQKKQSNNHQFTSQFAQIRLKKKKNSEDSIDTPSLQELDQELVIQGKKTQPTIYKHKDQIKLAQKVSTDEKATQPQQLIKQHTKNKIILNSNENKKFVFENIVISKRGSQLSQYNGQKPLNDAQSQELKQNERINLADDSDESILQVQSSQRQNKSNKQIIISSQSLNDGERNEVIQSQSKERQDSLEKKNEENEIHPRGRHKHQFLFKRRSQSATKTNIQEFNLNKTQRRSLIFDDEKSVQETQNIEQQNLIQKNQFKISVKHQNGQTIQKSKKGNIHLESLEQKNNQENQKRKISNLSNGRGQNLISQQEKNLAKKINMPLLNPNEQFTIKQKKRINVDPLSLLNQYQQFSKQENEKLIEQIKAILSKNNNFQSQNATPVAKQIKKLNSIDQNNVQKQNLESKSSNNLNKLQSIEEYPQPISEVELNDKMIYKIKTNLNYSSDLFQYDFDSMKIFKYYFPHNNYSNVVSRLKPKKLKNANRNTIKRRTVINSQNFNNQQNI
ncbi:cyclic nucleotide-binding domain protein (macronuclear) [Tetrahymena thermophila SB210]|uniref:Cyclic nucleotide-binding domain protein n=1 Tax=Tetrahymena thermophila (strain SB210) TaxID=312017 RepID=I7LW55_TETTS|nr:cyclic nucleotide-binding domain protein [Tetrahymena thermophila SB210]EAS00878.3 cyclic nucleotide-binding domain protein [Tetrahymena thermophila SB210]|eukprot:XP_001021124.3 cyclic nucleotide-binding domain protein [Tetrahymena thermophila SB210]